MMAYCKQCLLLLTIVQQNITIKIIATEARKALILSGGDFAAFLKCN